MFKLRRKKIIPFYSNFLRNKNKIIFRWSQLYLDSLRLLGQVAGLEQVRSLDERLLLVRHQDVEQGVRSHLLQVRIVQVVLSEVGPALATSRHCFVRCVSKCVSSAMFLLQKFALDNIFQDGTALLTYNSLVCTIFFSVYKIKSVPVIFVHAQMVFNFSLLSSREYTYR
jgi:hypothetical protein